MISNDQIFNQMRRFLAIFISPMVGCIVILRDLFEIYAYAYLISLIIQILLIESSLYIYSAFREVNLKTYLGLAIIYCMAFTILCIIRPSRQLSISDLNWIMETFGFFAAYSLGNIFCYYHLYFKHQVNNHEDV
ncbi:hypothetical protein J2Y60_003646 [Arcicella sp. BE140]|nr:hypothetical protein [Arcicella sp. BE51]MDR6813435.1 hypothetical protein [Arcicella sp. BE140]MDR6824748.1 hypothetical protein [Arcicella sp. BE139]